MRVRPYYEVSDAEWQEKLTELETQNSPRVLFRGATIVTMDPEYPDLAKGDLLIEGNRISKISADLTDEALTDGTVVIEAEGTILAPGLVDAHRHCWANSLRRLIPDVDLAGYMATTHTVMASSYRPQDMYAGDLATMLGALDSGVTCVLDFSHNSRSAAHADAVFAAYRDSGIRAVHASAVPEAGDWDRHWPDDLARLKEEYCSSPASLSTLRMAVVSRLVKPLDELMGDARSLGLGITLDAVLGPQGSETVVDLGRRGLLGPDVTLIHCTDLTDEAWRHIADSATRVTLAPTSDAQLGIFDGQFPIQKCLDFGIRPSLSVDVEMSLASDMFSQMRCVLTTQRSGAATRRYAGDPEFPMIETRDVLEFATIDSAKAIGLEDQIGSLTPGKQADLLMIQAEDINNMPLNNAIGTIVLGTDSKNISAVFVAGMVRKWNGRLVGQDLNNVRRLAQETRDHVASQVGLRVDPVVPVGR
ncbi:amidohydrolase family protein [Arthrobacter sp. MI7-26]|nr:amidohydrolase family protein [Arthrobacter sp. MI7-26]